MSEPTGRDEDEGGGGAAGGGGDPERERPTEDGPAGEASGPELLSELADDFARRYRGGERPSVEAYAAAHPALAEQIRDLFPALVAIEQSGPGPAASQVERVGGVLGGRYKLLERLGEGGWGVVYMAEQLRPVRRKVAVKVIKPGQDTRRVIARFEAERQALAVMEHENIARVLDAGATDSGRPYFVMELVRGVPITQYCDERCLSPRERLGLFVRVCRAVQHAHTKGIIHRDLKPTNVLVTSHDGVAVPKVIDFGVAKATGQELLTERTLFTHYAQMVGTPLYMSPEQAELSGLDVDTRSDVYSLGVMLYELLTGTTPFDKQRLAKAAYDEVRRIIREEEPPRPSTRLSTLGDALASVSARRHTDPKHLGQLVRGELDWIVMRAMEKDRTRRYPTANGLARDVERYLEDEPVEACPPSRVYRLRKIARRYRTGLSVAAAALALLVAGAAASTWQAVRATRAERAATTSHLEADQARTLAQANAAAATSEAARANTVVDLLLEMLSSADPQRAKGKGYTVQEMLRHFADGLGDRLKGQPEVEARVRFVIGQALRTLEGGAAARPQIDRAIQLHRQLPPDRVPLRERVDALIARADLGGDVPAAAREALDEAERLLAGAGLAESSQMAECLLQRGVLAAHTSRPQEAEALYKRADALAERCGNWSVRRRALIFLGGLLIGSGREEEQLEAARRNERLNLPRFPATSVGAPPPATAATATAPGPVSRPAPGMDRWTVPFVDAEAVLRQELDSYRRALYDGRRVRFAGGAEERISEPLRALVATGQREAAARYYAEWEQVMSALEAAGQTDDMTPWRAQIVRARYVEAAGSPDRAIALYEDGIRRLWQRDPMSTYRPGYWLQIVYRRRGRPDQAARLMEEQRAYLLALPPPQRGWMNSVLAHLFGSYAEMGDADKAAEVLSEFLGPDNHDGTVVARERFTQVMLLLRAGRMEDADRRASAIYARILRQGPREMAQSLIALRRLAAWLEANGYPVRAKAARTELVRARGAWASGDGDHFAEACEARFLNELAWEMVESPAECATAADRELALRVARAAVAKSPDDWTVLNTLGVALFRAGQFEGAVDVLQRSDQLRRVQVPAANGSNRLFHALALERLGRGDDAAAALRGAVAAKDLPAERLAEAAPALERLLDETRRAKGPADPEARRLLSRLALVHEIPLDDSGGAERLLRELLSLTSGSPAAEDVPTAEDVRLRLAGVLRRQGRFQEAERTAAEVVAALRTGPGQDRTALPAALAVVGEAMLGPRLPERAAAAEGVLRECVELRRRDAPYAWQTHDAASLLGEALLLQGRHGEAEVLLTDAARRMQPPAQMAYRRAEAVGRVVRLYEQWERAAPGRGFAELGERWKVIAAGG